MNFTIVNSVILLTVTPLTTVIFVQLYKTILNSILTGKFDSKTLFSDGDFPSAHTAILVSFNIVFWHIVYLYALNTPGADMFPPVLIGMVLGLWSCYIIRDAMGVRLRVQEHAYAIKQIALTSKDISDRLEKLKLIEEDTNSKALDEEIEDILKNIKLKVGHLPHEVLGGIVTGGLIGFLIISIIDRNFSLFTLISLTLIIYISVTIYLFVRKRKRTKYSNNNIS